MKTPEYLLEKIRHCYHSRIQADSLEPVYVCQKDVPPNSKKDGPVCVMTFDTCAAHETFPEQFND